jgi:predicted HTH domain antitoxin
MSKTTVTKSVRLTTTESEELAQLSEKTAITEAALMKKWILEGIRAQKLELAINSYMQRKTDLRGGAAMAEVSYNSFFQEVQARNIVILDEDRFQDRVAYLAEAFDDEALQSAVKKLVGSPERDTTSS